MKKRRRLSDKINEAKIIHQFIVGGFESVETVEKEIRSLSGRPRFVKGRWRGRQREKRLKLLDRMPEELFLDAPIGKYLIDEIALKFRESVRDPARLDTSKLLERLRERVSMAARAAVLWARWHVVWLPEAQRRTKRFLDDLSLIQFLIKRIENLKPSELMFSTEVTSRKYRGGSFLKRFTRLRKSLSDADMEIRTYLRIYKLMKRGGNHDRFTRFFILELLETWRSTLNGKVVNDEYDRFEEFVWAAWQDVQLSTIYPDGRSVREWLADRLRKQFPNGLPKSRKALLAAWGRT
jgi:hypothetical protein